MSIELALQTYLLSKTAITNLVGQRIYYNRLPESVITAPQITHWCVSKTHLHHLTAASGLSEARIQIDVWSSLLSDVFTVQEALRGVLDGFRGTMDSTDVTGCLLDNDSTTYEQPPDGSDLGIYHGIADYMFMFRESIPSF